MKNTTRSVLAVLAACAMSAIAAPQASADIDRILVRGELRNTDCDGEYFGYGCEIRVQTSGADALDPVTVLVDGAVIGTITPLGTTEVAHGSLIWRPGVNDLYTITVVQNESSRSKMVDLPYREPVGSSQILPSGSAG